MAGAERQAQLLKPRKEKEQEEGDPGRKDSDFKVVEAEPRGPFPVQMAPKPVAPLQEPSAGPAS